MRKILRAVSKFIDFVRRGNSDVSEWYEVGFTQQHIWRAARPPGKPSFKDRVCWKDITRVVFEASEWGQHDSIYVFSNLRPESYVIPVQARGGDDVWNEIVERGLFDADLAIQAALSSGGFFCWPPEQE